MDRLNKKERGKKNKRGGGGGVGCKEISIDNGSSLTLAEFGEEFGRHDLRRER